jgi:hypothetical protein
MKSLLIFLAVSGIYSQSVNAGSVRCSDEKSVIAIFHDNGFNPAGEAISHVSLYEIKPMETVLLDTLPCVYDRVRSPADVPTDTDFCSAPSVTGQARPYSARLYKRDQFGQRAAIISYKRTRNLTIPCKTL